MQLNGFAEELKRLCSLIFGDHNWLLWLHTHTNSHLIDTHHIRMCTLEERALIKNVTLSQKTTPFKAMNAPVMQHYLGNQSLQTTQFLTIETEGFTALLGFHQDTIQLAEISIRLILDRWNEWQLRNQLSQLIVQQQQRIQQSEERFEALQLQREQQTKQVITNWLQSHKDLTITLDAGIYNSFDATISETAILNQLENALKLVQFAHPNQTQYFLSASHLLPLPQIYNPIQTPLSSHQRIELLLDKYESSARIAQQNGFIVNGKTIAEHLQPPISPPAITDAMKKNKKAIGLLLEQYPEKWPLLRKFLKPVKELNERTFFQSLYQKTMN